MALKQLSERISYLKGLSEGLNVAETGPQGKIVNGILDVLFDVVDEISVMRTEFEAIKDYVESMDEDLNHLEEDLYCTDSEDDYVEVTCDNCGEEVYFDADILEDDDVIEVICPKCNEVVFINDGSFDMEPSIMDDELGDRKSPDNNNTRDS